jgi:hypothetical protein
LHWSGDIGRFPNPGHYASYACCVQSEKVSNGKPKGRGNAACAPLYQSSKTKPLRPLGHGLPLDDCSAVK